MLSSIPNRVWKVASRWSETGHPASSILDIFRVHNVVFVGKEHKQFGQIQEGDLIAISSGLKIVALGLANSPPCAITKMAIPFTEIEKSQFDYEDWVMGCRVSFTDLAEEDWRPCRQGTCHKVYDEADNLCRLYAELHHRFTEKQDFEIQARSCTLLRNPGHPRDVLWRSNLLFRVPVYQRPYSWKEPEIQRFIKDLLSAFTGINGGHAQEPMFIGTMQLAAKQRLDIHGRMVQDIIDGQQRLTTLIMALKVLRDRFPEDKVWAELALESRLATTVSSGTQQAYLEAALKTDSLLPYLDAQNPYLQAMRIIQGLLNEGVGNAEEVQGDNALAPAPLDVPVFVNYLISQVYFVVIETRASLSKTLQIFDAINTSGMDLNGGDVFKVRYFEYLQVTKKVADQEFERINSLYQAVDEGNKKATVRVCSIEDILSLAQHLLITRHRLAKELHSLASSTFFERFFDSVLNVQRWTAFSAEACKTAEIRLEELLRLVAARFEWERQIQQLGAEARCMLEFVWWSRYGRYYYLIVLFRDRFQPDAATTERFIIQLSKLFLLFSILYWKTVGELDRIMHELLDRICGALATGSANEVIAFLGKATGERKDRITNALISYELTGNAKAKNLACRLSALQDEMEVLEGRGVEELRTLVFDTAIDIEHIESWTHENEEEGKRIHKEWEGELNRLGNLMVLPSGVNRSIKNYDYKTNKLPAYASQKEFEIVRRQARLYPEWNLANCKERKQREVDKLVRYLCGPLERKTANT